MEHEFKAGDRVKVISGYYKGKTGIVSKQHWNNKFEEYLAVIEDVPGFDIGQLEHWTMACHHSELVKIENGLQKLRKINKDERRNSRKA